MFKKLIAWSEANYSHLPWRKNRNLYTTLVSEIMLQQTTVSTVLKHYEKFIIKYPDVCSLAKINEEQILIDWKGLGYYRRAKNLLKAAKDIVDLHNGEIPLNFLLLKEIHGIGDYTANALISIGANKLGICLDANLERVLARYYGIETQKGPKLQKHLYDLFSKGEICDEVSSVGARSYNEALMDLGRSICKARSATCEICPLASECKALASGRPLDFPKEKKEIKETQKYFGLELLRIIVQRENKILVYKKNNSQWLSGQFEIPTIVLASEDSSLKQYPLIKKNDECLKLLPSFRTSITKYRIDNYVLHSTLDELLKITNNNYEWKPLENLNLSTGSIKSMNLLK